MDTYVVLDEFIAAKSDQIQGWEVVERGNWIVHGRSSDSPDAARKLAIKNAEKIGANTLFGLEYYKVTGSEPGTGKGTHFFTIHGFRGRPMILAKRNSKGNYRAQDLTGLNENANSLKQQLAAKTENSKNIQMLAWVVILGVCAFVWYTASFEALLLTGFALLFIGLGFFQSSTDYDFWLERETPKRSLY